MAKVKNVTITITEEQQEKAKEIALEVIGKKSISGLFAYLITKYKLKSDEK